jgi:hypothetical protein
MVNAHIVAAYVRPEQDKFNCGNHYPPYNFAGGNGSYNFDRCFASGCPRQGELVSGCQGNSPDMRIAAANGWLDMPAFRQGYGCTEGCIKQERAAGSGNIVENVAPSPVRRNQAQPALKKNIRRVFFPA